MMTPITTKDWIRRSYDLSKENNHRFITNKMMTSIRMKKWVRRSYDLKKILINLSSLRKLLSFFAFSRAFGTICDMLPQSSKCAFYDIKEDYFDEKKIFASKMSSPGSALK